MSKLNLNNLKGKESGVATPSSSKEKAKSSSRLLSLAGAVGLAAAAALTPNEGHAETWNCGNDLDDMTGTTNYNDEAVYAFSGIPGGISTRSVLGSDSLLQVETTSDGISFSETRATLETVEPDLAGEHYSMSGAAWNTDTTTGFEKAVIYAYDGSYVVDNIDSGLASWSLTPLNNTALSWSSIGSITGDTYTTLEDVTPSYDHGIFLDSDGSEVYDTSDEETSGIIDEANNRLGVEKNDDFILVDLSGSTSDQLLATNAMPMQYLPYDISPNGYDTWIYRSGTSLYYCEDTDSGACTDTDGDDVCDDDDLCPTEDATGYDTDGDGCIDDLDGDGSPADEDCDDEDSYSYPGADEYCDGVDNDCDEEIDEDPVDGSTWYPDNDGDGYGNPDGAIQACDQPSGYVDNSSDCDDSDINMVTGCDTVVELSDGLSVEVSQGNAEDSVSFDEETGVLTLLVEGIEYTINVGTSPILASWEEEGVFADLGADARAEIMLGILAGALQTPPPPSAELGDCEDGVQYGPIDTDDQNRWMTVTLIDGGTTKSTVEVEGPRDMATQHLNEGSTIAVADTTYCSEEEVTDTDGDGLSDEDDSCPNEYAETDDGCPEEDDTGIPEDTAHPDQPVPTQPGGCDSASCSFTGVNPGPNAIALAAILAGLVARRRRRDEKK